MAEPDGTDRTSFASQPFLLPADVLVFPVEELAEKVRLRLQCKPGEFAVNRPGFRTQSRIVDADMAELLGEFRTATTISEAVTRFAKSRDQSPVAVLHSAFPALQRFSAASILVPADSPLAEGVVARYAEGQTLRGSRHAYEVLRMIRALEDSELYQARTEDGRTVALKCARHQALERMRAAFSREADVLGHLGGEPAPLLVEDASQAEHPFLALEWVAGINPMARAAELRTQRPTGWRHALHRLALRVIEAYVELHARQVIHGDVHPGNLLVDGSDRVTVLDYGLSRRPEGTGSHGAPQRSGLLWYMEPEAAACLASGLPLPLSSYRGEQASVAALVYTLVCGEFHGGPIVDQAQLMHWVVESDPMPFTRHGFEPWPRVESLLRRALDKNPDSRFGDLSELAAAFAEAGPPAGPSETRLAPAANQRLQAVERLFRDAAVDPRPMDELFSDAPRLSLHYGAAGLAWFLYRAALVRDDGRLLAAADLWGRRAQTAADHAAGLGECPYTEPDVGVTAQRLSGGSLYHGSAGLPWVRAHVCLARGDPRGSAREIERFVAAADVESDEAELLFGLSGRIVGASLLLEAARLSDEIGTTALEAWLDRKLSTLLELTANAPDPAAAPESTHLGMAHGHAGLLYAQLLAARVLDRRPEPAVVLLLDRLAQLPQPDGRGATWPGTLRGAGHGPSTPAHAPGWCAGTAGYVHLFTLADEVLGQDRYAALARSAAWSTFEHGSRGVHLCCGLSGRAFALLRQYQHDGDVAWLERARILAEACDLEWAGPEATGTRALSLYRGRLGAMLLEVELEAPEEAAMPGFASEGWPRPLGRPVSPRTDRL